MGRAVNAESIFGEGSHHTRIVISPDVWKIMARFGRVAEVPVIMLS